MIEHFYQHIKKMRAPAAVLRGGGLPVIQIAVTNACDDRCSNCTQQVPHIKKPFMISVEQFRSACRSVKGFPGVVGMFGGNPCTHPQFEELCAVMREELPDAIRGLWSNNFRGHGATIRQTFDPARSNLNVHLEMAQAKEMIRDWPEVEPYIFGRETDSWHAPVLTAMSDLIPDEEKRWRLISDCDINQTWSSIITVVQGKLLGYFCEIAGSFACLYDDPTFGIPIEGLDGQVDASWWRQPIESFEVQIRKYCHDCGVPLRGKGSLGTADHDQFTAKHEGVVRSHKRKLTKIETLAEMERNTRAATHYIVETPESPDRIAGLVVCVGETYAQTLEVTLPRWLHTLDSVCVVTHPDDQSTLQVLEDYACAKLRVFTTDCFDKDGAWFNKGRAMSEAVHAGAVDTSAWVLAFDADVLPPLDWRKGLSLQRGVVYGTRRVAMQETVTAMGRTVAAGHDIDTHGDPIGAFTLFWGKAPEASKSPMFAVGYPSAGGVDSEFVWRWPSYRRRLLPILVSHYGRPFSNWCGVGKDAELAAHQEYLAAGGEHQTINVAWPPKGEK